MKLSDAIRLGSMIRPKADGYFFRAGASCAQGAALEAIGVLDRYDSDLNHDLMCEYFPIVEQKAACPACGDSFLRTVKSIIPHLNNTSSWSGNFDHGWSREQIADWVETIERAAEAKDDLPQPVSDEALVG